MFCTILQNMEMHVATPGRSNGGVLLVSHGAVYCRVLQPLQAAAAGFAALEDFHKAAEAQHLIALVCHAINNTSRRNVAAGEFHKLTWHARQGQVC